MMQRKKSTLVDHEKEDGEYRQDIEDEDESHTVSKSWFSDFIYVKLWEPVNASSLVFYRICWGLIMAYETSTYIRWDYSKIRYLLGLKYSFKYYGFEWVDVLPGDAMYYLVYLMLFVSLCISIGFCYRICSLLFFFMFSYLFLIEMTSYLNHFYLICIVCLLFVCIPANCCFSADSWINPKSHSYYVPYWNVWIVKTFLSIVYVYAGIAKINEDWLRGEPLLHWLPRKSHLPIIGPLVAQPWLALLFSYGGLFLDLFLAPALMVKPLRPFAFTACIFFHIMNKVLFNIGVFPWVMLASTTIYFEPDWLVTLWDWLISKPEEYKDKPNFKPVKFRGKLTNKQKLILACIFIFLAHQILVPLRHLLYPGDVNWDEEGHRFSWRMKLRDKKGVANFFITLPNTNETVEVDKDILLEYRQERKMSCRPELIHLFASHLADIVEESKGVRPRVTVEAICSLNYRPFQYMVDPTFDLASVAPWSWPNKWVVPLAPLGTPPNPEMEMAGRIALSE